MGGRKKWRWERIMTLTCINGKVPLKLQYLRITQPMSNVGLKVVHDAFTKPLLKRLPSAACGKKKLLCSIILQSNVCL